MGITRTTVRFQALSGSVLAAIFGVLLPAVAACGSEIAVEDRSSSSHDSALAPASGVTSIRPFSSRKIEDLARGVAGLDSRKEILDRLETSTAQARNLAEDPADLPRTALLPPSPITGSLSSGRQPNLAGEQSSPRAQAPEILTQPVLANSPIPEPASILIVLTGLVGLILRSQMRRGMAR